MILDWSTMLQLSLLWDNRHNEIDRVTAQAQASAATPCLPIPYAAGLGHGESQPTGALRVSGWRKDSCVSGVVAHSGG